jgi:hypothetical protein
MRRVFVIFYLLLSLTCVGDVAPTQMAGDQKILHALNRLTFGPRASDVEEVRRIGLQAWIDRQLHPESIPENPALEAKLEALDTLRMSPRELVQQYPPPQLIKAMAEGRLPMPSDPAKRAAVQNLIERYKAKQGSGGEVDSDAAIASLPLSEEEKAILRNGSPEARLALIASVPAEQQWTLLEALSNGARQQLYPFASPALRRRIQIFNGPFQVVSQDLTEAKLLRAAYSNRQLEEVLTDFWYNHFNVDLDKGADRFLVTSYERDVIRPHVLGRFQDLLLATAESPAMLFYLDNWQSTRPDVKPHAGQKQKTGLNENYGRELMELHTLGVDGGYTQREVTEVARCFTGWTIREPRRGGSFEFDPRRHDNGEKHVVGVKIPAGGGMEDGLKVLEILSHHPSTALFISRSLAVRFVSDNPPDTLVKKMADKFTATDGDLREVMRAMIEAPEFWDQANFRSKVKSPLEMTVSAIRAIDADIDYTFAMNGVMTQLGEPLYRKLEPTGYSNRSADWMNSASLLARMNYANSLAQGRINGIRVDTSQFSGDPSQIERRILLADPSRDAQDAIEAALADRKDFAHAGPLVAGLTLGSPDFQRR